MRACHAAGKALVAEVNAALPRVKELYASGKVTPLDDVGRDKEGTGAGAPAGSATESACSAANLRKALASGDEAFLRNLEGKLVVVKGMVLKPPKAEGDVALAEIMAGGGTLPVAFPTDTPAAALSMATKVIVTGEAVKAGDRWLFRASEWGRARDVDAGQPLTRCAWPEAESGAEKDAGAAR